MPIDSLVTPLRAAILSQERKVRPSRLFRRRNAHQPFDRETILASQRSDEPIRIQRRDARLALPRPC